MRGFLQVGRWMAMAMAVAWPVAHAAEPPEAKADARVTPAPHAAATLIVLNKAEATASLIDLASGKVAATVPTGQGPHEVAVAPDGRTALVANYGDRSGPGSSLTVIDIARASVVRTLDLGRYQRPHGLEWIDGRRAVVTAEAQKALLVVDVEKAMVESAVDTGQDVAHMVALDGRGRAWVASIGSGTATAVDLATGKVLKTIATGRGAEGIDVTPDGSEVWVTNREEGTVTVIDTTTLEPKATLNAGAFPIRATVTPDGRYVLVSNARSADLSVFDAAGKNELRRVRFAMEGKGTEGRLLAFEQGSTPIGIVVQPDGRRAYVAQAGADVVSIVDLASWSVVGRLTAGKEPDGMALSAVKVDGR